MHQILEIQLFYVAEVSFQTINLLIVKKLFYYYLNLFTFNVTIHSHRKIECIA